MPDWGIALPPPKAADVHFIAAPVPILLHSLLLMKVCATNSSVLPGIAPWPHEALRRLSESQRDDIHCMYWFLGDRLFFDYYHLTFPQFLQELERTDATALRDDVIGWMKHKEGFTSLEAVLNDFSVYESFIQPIYHEKAELLGPYDAGFHRRLWALLQDPPALKARIVHFLTTAWDQLLHQEWKRIQPLLTESVELFSQRDYSGMSTSAVVKYVTTRDLASEEYFEKSIHNATYLMFVPSPYLGPYVTWMHDEVTQRDMVFFGVRQPRDVGHQNAALRRSELLVWLNALADETRLRMLEMLAREEEICAQDFITTLELSQSSASRHLRQLTASGYVTERRRDVAKCYSLNRERVEDTVRALQQLLGER
jgi:DNA-binding transcriptional ArsR family regulator